MPENLLGDYFSKPTSPVGPGAVDIAKLILLNAQNTNLGPGKEKARDPSFMSRIFDLLSRPNYAIAETVDRAIKGELDPVFPFGGIIGGLTGKDKTTFQDVLREHASGALPGPTRAALGLALDIGLDPLTYVPLPVGKGLNKLKLVKTPRVSPEKNVAQKILEKGEPVVPESFGLKSEAKAIPEGLKRKNTNIPDILDLSPKAGFETSQPTLPGFADKLSLPDIKIPEKAKVIPKQIPGQQALRFPGFSVKKATKIVDEVAEHDPISTLRVMPVPKPTVQPRHQKIAEEILTSWDPKAATAQLNKQFPDSLNAKQQVRLYYKALDAAKKQFKKPNASVNKPRVQSIAFKIYMAMEKSLEAQGFVPRIGSGENVRLSDVIQNLGGSGRASEVLDEFSKDILEGSPTWQAIQALKAQGAITDSNTVKLITEKIAEAKTGTEVAEALVPDFGNFLKNFGKATARGAGVSPVGVKTTGKLIDTLLASDKSHAQMILEQKSKILDDVIAKSKTNSDITNATTKALEKDLGKLPNWAVNDNKASEFFMARVATWWGQSDLRPLSLTAVASSSATAAARGKVLDEIFRPFDLTQRHEALRAAQGLGQANTHETLFLANQIRNVMDSLFNHISSNSVLLRSGVHLEHLNNWMRRYHTGFEFSRGKIKTFTGEVKDLSKGSDWTDSWKYVQIDQDPKLWLFKVQQAMEQATREKALFDELGERFGTRVPGGAFKNKITGHAYIGDYYFPDDIARQIPRVIKDWSQGNWNPKSPLVKHYDRVLSMWKSGVTIYRPGHHIRNMVGDVYLGWMDGVNTLRPYILAAKVQKSMKGAYQHIADVDMLVDVGALGKSYHSPTPNQVLFRNKSGTAFTAEQIAAVAHQKGLLEHTRTLEDIIDLGEESKFKPFGGKVQAIARGASELNTHNTRLAHFIDKVAKSKGNDLEKIFEEASQRARKWHPTGLDLTDFEKKYLRRVIPFYSWIRKSTPLLIEGLLMNPGKAVVPAKIGEALQEAGGIDSPSRLDPFPTDQLFPHWIKAQGTGPISTSEGFLGKFSNNIPPGYIMGGVGLNPLQDLISQLENPGKMAVTSLTPGIQIPVELAAGRELFTGEPITGIDSRPGSLRQYIGEQIPIVAPLQNITGITPFGSETKRGANLEALINYLTAAGIRGTGPYRAQARYEELAPGRMNKKIGKEEFLEDLRGRLG